MARQPPSVVTGFFKTGISIPLCEDPFAIGRWA
jgi:hypothetical protein